MAQKRSVKIGKYKNQQANRRLKTLLNKLNELHLLCGVDIYSAFYKRGKFITYNSNPSWTPSDEQIVRGFSRWQNRTLTMHRASIILSLFERLRRTLKPKLGSPRFLRGVESSSIEMTKKWPTVTLVAKMEEPRIDRGGS
jgi:hypothetical protein